MNWYLKRAGQAVFTLWAVVSISFVLAWSIPGSMVERYVTQIASSTGQNPEAIRRTIANQLMYDPEAPVYEAYLTYMSNVLQGNLGTSWTAQSEVNALLVDTVPWTLLVMSLATTGLFALSLTLGAVMAYREGSRFDLANTAIGIVTTSIPYYVAGILLILWVGYGDGPITGLFPARYRMASGVSPGPSLEFVSAALRHATLPALSFVLTQYGLLALAMRGNSIQTLGEDYVEVAQLRGIPERRIALRYVGRNAILPMYTSLLLAIGFMLGGSVILEQIFQYRGVGIYMYQGIQDRDVVLMMGTFLVITVAVVIATFVADVTYSKLDPRIKAGEQGEAY
ncbi:ABC transporter permease [Halosimplex salinum]|uniref:ABC transporter permease n=1 Tax=Halosimplex salinum TaxID=1710538 RepID=UPI000F473AA1|nr:ABC transporter permease [Halosimplex salinum]